LRGGPRGCHAARDGHREVIRHVWGLSDRICPLRFPEGVFKHRTIEAAERLREQWEDANSVHIARG
jgi:hypothetical protein